MGMQFTIAARSLKLESISYTPTDRNILQWSLRNANINCSPEATCFEDVPCCLALYQTNLWASYQLAAASLAIIKKGWERATFIYRKMFRGDLWVCACQGLSWNCNFRDESTIDLWPINTRSTIKKCYRTMLRSIRFFGEWGYYWCYLNRNSCLTLHAVETWQNVFARKNPFIALRNTSKAYKKKHSTGKAARRKEEKTKNDLANSIPVLLLSEVSWQECTKTLVAGKFPNELTWKEKQSSKYLTANLCCFLGIKHVSLQE